MRHGKRIIVGPHAMRIKCHGIRSEEIELGARDTPEQVQIKAADLWETIRPFVSWKVWHRHRMKMYLQRHLAAAIQTAWPGPYFRGPRPDLIAQRPWKDAAAGDWTMLPHGVVNRLLRAAA